LLLLLLMMMMMMMIMMHGDDGVELRSSAVTSLAPFKQTRKIRKLKLLHVGLHMHKLFCRRIFVHYNMVV